MSRCLLGIDLGSSSVKVSLLSVESGENLASAFYPECEAPIKALRPGWAEQNPEDWWSCLKMAMGKALAKLGATCEVAAIGISYQMHGLVCLDKERKLLRDAIIWCDSRGVPYGEKAYDELGSDRCLTHLLNSPGNFTAAKLAWVKENEPALFEKIRYILLPGDYMAMRLTGEVSTTALGLSEMMLWDYKESEPATWLMDYYGFAHEILPTMVPTIGLQGRLTQGAAQELGLNVGIPVAYRSGDQPNNALSLNVFNPGEIASTAGTSGVVYGVSDKAEYDSLSRVNTFLHVNHSQNVPRMGMMHCVNGCGILNSWLRHNVCGNITYERMNQLADTVEVGSEGLTILPFGNGAERVLQNQDIASSISGLNFNRHTLAHMVRAGQEGIAFSLLYGIEVMQNLGMKVNVLHAGKSNLFLSPIFTDTLSSASGSVIELYNTDGSIGAARAAGLGAGIYASSQEAFASLKCLQTIEPANNRSPYLDAYLHWKQLLQKNLSNTR